MDLKGKDILFKLGEGSPEEITFKKTPPLDFTKKQFLPSILYVISKKYTILSEFDGNWHDRDKKVLKDLAQELWNNWIYINVPPLHLKNVELKLDKLFKLVSSGKGLVLVQWLPLIYEGEPIDLPPPHPSRSASFQVRGGGRG